MAEAKLIAARDGYPARVAPLWTEDKLRILSGYLPVFARACRRAKAWYALDAFAGLGLNYSETRGVEIPGSALIALEAGPPDEMEAAEVVMAEKHPKAFKALEHRTASYGSRACRFNEDCNRVIGEMLDRIPRWAPTFAFLDPEGSELEWPTVEAIADHKRDHAKTKIEQLILFSDTGMARLGGEHPDYVSRVFGHDRWREIRERRDAGQITADEARTDYVQMYAQGLRDIGYAEALDRQIEKPNGAPMYFLIFASDHEAGKGIMDNRFDQVRARVQEELGQGQLFPTPEPPRRTRLD